MFRQKIARISFANKLCLLALATKRNKAHRRTCDRRIRHPGPSTIRTSVRDTASRSSVPHFADKPNANLILRVHFIDQGRSWISFIFPKLAILLIGLRSLVVVFNCIRRPPVISTTVSARRFFSSSPYCSRMRFSWSDRATVRLLPPPAVRHATAAAPRRTHAANKTAAKAPALLLASCAPSGGVRFEII